MAIRIFNVIRHQAGDDHGDHSTHNDHDGHGDRDNHGDQNDNSDPDHHNDHGDRNDEDDHGVHGGQDVQDDQVDHDDHCDYDNEDDQVDHDDHSDYDDGDDQDDDHDDHDDHEEDDEDDTLYSRCPLGDKRAENDYSDTLLLSYRDHHHHCDACEDCDDKYDGVSGDHHDKMMIIVLKIISSVTLVPAYCKCAINEHCTVQYTWPDFEQIWVIVPIIGFAQHLPTKFHSGKKPFLCHQQEKHL